MLTNTLITSTPPTMPPIEGVCFILNLKLGTIPNSKKVPSSAIQIRREMPFDPDTDTDALRVSKILFDCEELNEIRSFHHSLRDYIESRELPTRGQFRGGMYLMAYARLGEIEERLKDASEQMNELIDRFIEVLPERIAESCARLGTLYNEYDYPTPKMIRERLRLVYEYQTLATPEGLKKFSQELHDREAAKLRARMEEAAADVQEIIAQRAKDLLTAIADRLTPDLSGKPKVMRKDMIASWNEALDLLSDQNITGNADLAAVIEQAKAKLEGRDSLTMKGDAAVRTEITTTFNDLIARLDEQVIDKPLRQISFEEAA